MNKRKFILLALLALTMVTVAFAADAWRSRLAEQLPLLGHRNWIVVADSAYPLQTAPGIETIYVNADQLEVVKGVIAELAKTRHVKPTIYTDAEMKSVAEKNAESASSAKSSAASSISSMMAYWDGCLNLLSWGKALVPYLT